MTDRYFNPLGLSDDELTREKRLAVRRHLMRKKLAFWTLERMLLALGGGCTIVLVAFYELIKALWFSH